MYRLLLVDDDTIVRMYLSDIVKWEEYGIRIVGAARDGAEALRLSRELKPDVVLTDMEMPKMNGVELITALRNEDFRGVINVLSCHDDFEMVKSAMQRGADDYLLKNHLNERSVGEVAEKIKGQIEQKLKKYNRRNEIKSLANKGLEVMRRELMQEILSGRLSDEELKERCENAELKGAYRQVIAVIIAPFDAEKDQMDAVLALLEQRLENEKAEIMYLKETELVLLIDLSDEPSANRGIEISNRLQTVIQRITAQYLNLETAIAASAVCDGNNSLRDALRQASALIENSFYGPGRWQYGQNSLLSKKLPAGAVLFRNQLAERLECDDDDEIRRAYLVVLDDIRKQRIEKETVDEWIQSCDVIANHNRMKSELTRVQCFEAYDELIDVYFEEHVERLNKDIPENTSLAIRKALMFIHGHFREQISLSLVAQNVNLSMTYFSTLFKKEIGCGFSDYIAQLRLKWFCNRIVSTNLTLKQVSEEAGFQDYPYFCKTFKKKYGTSPAEFRRRNTQ